MFVIGVLLLFATLTFSEVSQEEFARDREYLLRIEKAIERIDKKVSRGDINRDLLGELNSYGYPLYTLKEKYLREKGKRSFYERIDEVYNKMLYIKRGAFPSVLRTEFKALNIPFCNISAQGKRRETLVIGIRHPEDEETVMKIMTQTQLRNAHLIGLENLKFEKCR